MSAVPRSQTAATDDGGAKMKRGKSATGTAQTASEQLAIDGGTPVRTEPLPLEFPGVHYLGEEETEAALRVLSRRSLFRHYGIARERGVFLLEDCAQCNGGSVDGRRSAPSATWPPSAFR